MTKSGKRKDSETATIMCWNCESLVEVRGDLLIAGNHPACTCGQEISAAALLRAMHAAFKKSLRIQTKKLAGPRMPAIESAKAGVISRHIQAINEAERPYKERIEKLSAVNATFEKLMKKRRKV